MLKIEEIFTVDFIKGSVSQTVNSLLVVMNVFVEVLNFFIIVTKDFQSFLIFL